MKFAPIGLRAANEFVRQHHRHNKPVRGHKFALALHKDNIMIGVAIAGRPLARSLDNGKNLEVLRVCVIEGNKNACSKLYARIKRIGQLMGYEKVITYTLKTESQSSLKAILATPVSFEAGGQSWNHGKRKRQEQTISMERKIRWEL